MASRTLCSTRRASYGATVDDDVAGWTSALPSGRGSRAARHHRRSAGGGVAPEACRPDPPHGVRARSDDSSGVEISCLTSAPAVVQESATRMSTTRTDEQLDAARPQLGARSCACTAAPSATPSANTCWRCDYAALSRRIRTRSRQANDDRDQGLLELGDDVARDRIPRAADTDWSIRVSGWTSASNVQMISFRKRIEEEPAYTSQYAAM